MDTQSTYGRLSGNNRQRSRLLGAAITFAAVPQLLSVAEATVTKTAREAAVIDDCSGCSTLWISAVFAIPFLIFLGFWLRQTIQESKDGILRSSINSGTDDQYLGSDQLRPGRSYGSFR